jgi:ribosomal protein S14
MRLSGNERPGEWPYYKDNKCAVCGGKPSAIWRGHDVIHICPQCARDILPRLIADALTPEDSEYDTILDNFRSLETPYLQAALCRATASRRRTRRP